MAAGDEESGATVHVVTGDYDQGPILRQRRVPVYLDDAPEDLQRRVLKEEHLIYSEVIRDIVAGGDQATGVRKLRWREPTMYDTSRDPCLLVAQIACAAIRRALSQKSSARAKIPKKEVAELLGKVESAVMTLLYSYQERPELVASDAMLLVGEAAKELSDRLEPAVASPESPPLVRATVRWVLRTFHGLSRRLDASTGSLASGVDLMALQVRNIAPIGKALWRTRVTDDHDAYTVVTNISGVRKGDVLAAAFLPPREVGGEVSEAMFLGDEKRAEEPGAFLSDQNVDAREATSILHDEINR